MDSKIEQVKKILYQGYLTDIAAEKINALYSPEPQVYPKPEQMMICPKAGECKYICGSSHDKPHNQKDGCIGYPLQGCPACIPVPSTPASDGILTEMLYKLPRIKTCSGCIYWKTCARTDPLNWGKHPEDYPEMLCQKEADIILSKVSASFSAQLAEALKAQKEHILAEVDKAGLTDEQLYHLEQDYGWGKDTEERGFILSVADIVAAAQLENIKKQVMK